MKRVLLTTHPSAYLHHGGGEREILLLRDALEDFGVRADIYGPASGEVSVYDFAIHSSLIGGSEYLLLPLAEAGIRLILWPNLWFATPPSPQCLANLTRLLSHFEAVVFRSRAEEAHFRQYFDLYGKAVIHASCLVSTRFQRRDVSDVFRKSYGLNRYAIWAGIIEPLKNQLVAVRAFRDLDIDLIISGRVRDHTYLERCKEEAGPNVHFIPPMAFGSELHLSALVYSDLFVELPFDFPGTSAVEAAVTGCKLLLARCAWTQEVLGDVCTQVDPSDVVAVREAVKKSLIDTQSSAAFFNHASMQGAVINLIDYISKKEEIK
jgi:glycosyltransferase involved in cell wall biosynthesis